MVIDLKTDGNDILLPILAQPKAGRNAIVGVHNGRLKVAVTQAPERGKANHAILKLLAKELGLKRSQLKLVSGETSRRKVVRIVDGEPERLREMISCQGGPSE